MLCARNIYTLNCLQRSRREKERGRNAASVLLNSGAVTPTLFHFPSSVFQFNLWLLRSGLIFALSSVLSYGLDAGNLKLCPCLLCLHLPQVGPPPDPKPCPGEDLGCRKMQCSGQCSQDRSKEHFVSEMAATVLSRCKTSRLDKETHHPA